VEKKMKTKSLSDLSVKIFADGAEKKGMVEMYAKPYIKGFTTNPTLMRKSGITDYKAFALDILQAIPDRPISLEVFSDDLNEMKRQALTIAEWGKNIYVKIPVTNTKGLPTYDIIHELAEKRVCLNVTAVMTLPQVKSISAALGSETPSIISIFAGRIADTGVDPVPHMSAALDLMRGCTNQELIWASPREVLNIFQADKIGCHIITVTNDILKKLELYGKDLDEYSLDTVKMFHHDAMMAGYDL
jgi:transaldolase